MIFTFADAHVVTSSLNKKPLTENRQTISIHECPIATK
jgi:hypothetical protein